MLRKFFSTCKLLANYLFKSHYNALFVQYEFVHTEQQEREENRTNVEGHFKFRFCFLMLTIAVGMFGLPLEAGYSSDAWNVEKISTNPYIWIHQMYPPQLWQTMDIVLTIVTAYCVLNSLASMHYGVLEHRFRMIEKGFDRKWIQINGKNLSAEDSSKILSLHSKAKYIQIRMTILFVLVILIFYYLMILYNSVYVISLLSALYWFVMIPSFAFTLVYEMITKIIYVFMCCEYISIRQKSLLSQFVSFNDNLQKIPSNKISLDECTLIWQKHQQLNQNLMRICVDLHAYATFWTPYLTLTFINYTTYVSYMLYSVIIVENNPLVFKIYYIYFICSIGLLFYLTIRQCAKVVKANQAILRENRQFYIRFQTFKQENLTVKSRRLLKAESLLVPRSMHSYAFRLFGDYRITSKSFNVV